MEWDEVLQDIINSYNTRAGSDGLSPYELMYDIPRTQVSTHISSRTDLIETTENIIVEAEKNERYIRIVLVMAISSQRTDRSLPWKSIDIVHFKFEEIVIVALL